jgi:outer membrane lipoprotein-sorting protein
MKGTARYVWIMLLIVGLGLFKYAYPGFSYAEDQQAESELNRVISNIKKKEKTLKTFAATFKQTKQSQLLREPLQSEGLIYFDMNGNILMQVISPSPLTLLLKNNQLVLYYPDLSRVEKKTFGKTDNIFRKYLGIGEPVEALKKKFEIKLVTNSHLKGYLLKMIPKDKTAAKYMAMIEILVDPEHWLPEQIYFKEQEGDYTHIQLQFTSVNAPLPPDIFVIELPGNKTTTRQDNEQ